MDQHKKLSNNTVLTQYLLATVPCGMEVGW